VKPEELAETEDGLVEADRTMEGAWAFVAAGHRGGN
jgi:hypothetical protein